jgi:membrane protease YdiL (CAAX protease family)
VLEPAPERLEPPVVTPPAVLPIERAAAALEVILCSGYPTQLIVIVVLRAFGMHEQLADGRLSATVVFTLTLIDTILLVGLVAFFFRAHRESMRRELFGSRVRPGDLLLGVALIPASFMLVVLVRVAVQLTVPSLRNVPHNPFSDLMKTRGDAVAFAFVAMVAGGVREEIQRGFVLRRFEQYLGGGGVGLIVFSALFGLGHLPQGRDVALATGVLGAFWGATFLWRRTILPSMIAHAGFNLAEVFTFFAGGS